MDWQLAADVYAAVILLVFRLTSYLFCGINRGECWLDLHALVWS